jgi:hypothetical protein
VIRTSDLTEVFILIFTAKKISPGGFATASKM